MSIMLGILVGLVLGLTGAGGSIFAVPLLMAGLAWPITQAATVSLLAVSMSTALGTVLAWRHSYVRYRAALMMAATGIACAPFGIRLADGLHPQALVLLFAGVLFVVAFRMFCFTCRRGEDARVLRATVSGEGPPAKGHLCAINPATGRLVWTPLTFAVIGSIGAATGFLSGLLGVGGGFVIVPALRATTPFSMHSAVATSLMAIGLISLGTVASGVLHGRPLPLGVALPFVAGALAGMALGRVVAPRLDGLWLQRGFSVLAALVAAGMAGRVLFAA